MYRIVALVLAELFRMLAIFGPFLQIFWLYFDCLHNVNESCKGLPTVVVGPRCVRVGYEWDPPRFECEPKPLPSHFSAGQWCILTHPDFILCVLIFFLFLVPFVFCLVAYISRDDWAPWRWYVNLYRPVHDAVFNFVLTPDFAVLVISFLFMILTWLLCIGIFQY